MSGWNMNGSGFRDWRTSMKQTQAEVAEKFQVTRNTIQNWESTEGPLPIIIQQGCQVLERRIKQTWPDLGPVTLGWLDGPTFVSPGQRAGMIQSRSFKTNSEALKYVRKRWNDQDFQMPFVRYEEFGLELWNVVELERVASGADTDAP